MPRIFSKETKSADAMIAEPTALPRSAAIQLLSIRKSQAETILARRMVARSAQIASNSMDS
jgi:hypothetical protein